MDVHAFHQIREFETTLPAAKDWSAYQRARFLEGTILLERAAYLRKLARAGNGSASEILREYPQHAAMLSFRIRDVQSEVHEGFADLFYVLEGRAMLLTGCTVT